MIPKGLCQCGCGQRTNIADRTRPGICVKGEPRRYINGHYLHPPGPDYIEDEQGCWIWQRSVAQNGYGRLYDAVHRRELLAHRHVYELMVGPIPEGLTLDHLCRVRRCVNPSHLDPCTLGENTMRGEGVATQNARKTHCKRGHEFDAVTPEGHRRCLRCSADSTRRGRQARRAQELQPSS